MRGHTNQVGSALMGTGGIGLAALLGVADVSNEAFAHYWHRWWFLLLVALAGVVILGGLYVVLAGVIPWLPPRSWTSRARPERIGIDAEDTDIELGEGSIR